VHVSDYDFLDLGGGEVAELTPSFWSDSQRLFRAGERLKARAATADPRFEMMSRDYAPKPEPPGLQSLVGYRRIDEPYDAEAEERERRTAQAHYQILRALDGERKARTAASPRPSSGRISRLTLGCPTDSERTMTDDVDPLAPQAAALQAAGEQKYGADVFGTMITAVGQSGVSQDVMRRVVANPNALGNFTALAQESLLRVMQNTSGPKDTDFKIADQAYSAIREEQRDRHRGRRR
jgi:hypothetical protein